jgi:uncharacterized protein YecT (DUF1311 family)
MWAIKSLLVGKAVLVLCNVRQTTQGGTRPDDPCGDKNSNREMRECYANEQARVNAQADALVARIASDQIKAATDPVLKGVVGDLLKKAASTLTLSQQTCKTYRDQHCEAMAYSWTNGSGAGTAYESCMFQLGKARVGQLRSDFPETTP